MREDFFRTIVIYSGSLRIDIRPLLSLNNTIEMILQVSQNRRDITPGKPLTHKATPVRFKIYNSRTRPAYVIHA